MKNQKNRLVRRILKYAVLLLIASFFVFTDGQERKSLYHYANYYNRCYILNVNASPASLTDIYHKNTPLFNELEALIDTTQEKRDFYDEEKTYRKIKMIEEKLENELFLKDVRIEFSVNHRFLSYPHEVNVYIGLGLESGLCYITDSRVWDCTLPYTDILLQLKPNLVCKYQRINEHWIAYYENDLYPMSLIHYFYLSETDDCLKELKESD